MDPSSEVDHLTKRYKKCPTPPSTTSASTSAPASCSRSSARTAPARRRRSRSSPRPWPRPREGHDRRSRPRPRRDGCPAQHRDHLPEPDASTSTSRREENIRLHVALYGIYGYRPFYRLMPAEYRAAGRAPGRVVGLERELFRPLKYVLGRHEAEARDHPEPHAPARGPVPRRADVGPRPGEPRRSGATCATSATTTARRSSSRPTTSRRPRRPTASASSTTAASR